MVKAAVHPAITASSPNSRASSAIKPTRGRSRNSRNAPKSEWPLDRSWAACTSSGSAAMTERDQRKRPQPDRDAVDAETAANQKRGDQRAGGAKSRHQREHRAPALAVSDRDQRVAGGIDRGAACRQQDRGTHCGRGRGAPASRTNAMAINRLPSDSTRWQPTRSTRLPATAVKTNWPAKKTTSSRACAATSKPSAAVQAGSPNSAPGSARTIPKRN